MQSRVWVFLMLVLSWLTCACQKSSVKQQSQQAQIEQNESSNTVEGYFAYMADANMFVSCDEKYKASILMQGKAYLDLERQYLALQVSPQKIYLKMHASLVDRKTEQQELKKPVWHMESIIELDKNKRCSH